MKHVFISYVHENEKVIVKLSKSLAKHGVKIWLDKNDIMPGTYWKNAIRDAIANGDFFIACFSKEYNERASSYMNEELILAIDVLRRQNYNQAWFIPILFSGEIPDMDIGAGKTLRDLQYVELNNRNWEKGIARILSVINPVRVTEISPSKTYDQLLIDALDFACLTLAQGESFLFRAYVMMPSSKNKDELEIKYWSSRMFNAPDLSIKFQKWQGVTGYAWGYLKPVVADMTVAREIKGGAEWGLTTEQRMMTKNLNAIMSIPIMSSKEPNKIIGILNFDSHSSSVEFFIQESTQQVAANLAAMIGAIIDKES